MFKSFQKKKTSDNFEYSVLGKEFEDLYLSLWIEGFLLNS